MFSLIAVHIAIVAHVVDWRVRGRTLGSVQLSESMKTFELGEVNPALVLFALALLTTLLFGRFFCGWACHMGALQDLCLWILRKTGARPKPFRTRLLPYIPVALGLYMFVWPTARRELVSPALAAWWPDALRFIGPSERFPGLSAQFTTENLWGELPGLWLAIPFLLVCGFAAVYFLGSRGFCNYGCPYGGLFRPIEKLAPWRVTVDPSKCDSCGRCTAACSADVRVLEEISACGAVIDTRCIRSLDCVSVCPQGALSLAPAGPAPVRTLKGKTPRRRTDAPLRAEFGLLALFALVLFSTRGLYGVVPLLLAIGVAGCVCAMAWVALSLRADRDVRLRSFQLKRRGRLTAAGGAYLTLCIALTLLLVHSAVVKFFTWRASHVDRLVTIGPEHVFAEPRTDIPEEQVAAAYDALARYERAGSWRRGGLGLADTPANDVRIAWLRMVVADGPGAEDAMRRAIGRERPSEALTMNLARILVAQGKRDEAIEHLVRTNDAHPAFAGVRTMLTDLLVRSGRTDEAIALLRRTAARRPHDVEARVALAATLAEAGRLDDAVEELRSICDEHPRSATARQRLGVALFMRGEVDAALLDLHRAAALDRRSAPGQYLLGAEMLEHAGREGEARLWRQRAADVGGIR